MANAINNSTFTFNAEELKDWSKVIHLLTFGSPDLTAIHAVEEGIKHNMQIVFSKNEGLMGKAVTGCTPNPITGISLSEKRWTPVFEDFRLEHCSAEVNQQDKLINQMAKMNPDFYKILEGSQKTTGDFLVAAILERWKQAILRKVWFSDKNALAANFTTGTDLGYFNTFDGLFKQIFSEIPTNAKNYVAIAKNAGANYAAQELAAGEAKTVLTSIISKSDSRLRGRADAKMLVTRSLYDAYLNDLESLQNTGAGNTLISENGQTTLRVRGYEVMAMDMWDRDIAAYLNNGTKLDKPHRAVFTTSDNIPVGTLSVDDFGTVDAFYDQYRKVNVIDGIYSIDAKFLVKEYATVAY